MSISLTGTLNKISNQKKLQVEIDLKQFTFLHNRAVSLAKTAELGDCRKPTWQYGHDEGKARHFITVTLDKYDKANLRKFEQMLKAKVTIKGTFKPYDFIPEGATEQCIGINFEQVSIFKHRAQPDALMEVAEKAAKRAEQRLLEKNSNMTEFEQSIDGDVDAAVAAQLGLPLAAPRLVRQNATSEASLDEINRAIKAHEKFQRACLPQAK